MAEKDDARYQPPRRIAQAVSRPQLIDVEQGCSVTQQRRWAVARYSTGKEVDTDG